MYVENFHGVKHFDTFKVELICKHDYATVQSSDLVPAAKRYVEEFIDTAPAPFAFDAEFTSAGDAQCPIRTYEIYSAATNTTAAKGYAGFTLPETRMTLPLSSANAARKSVVIDSTKFASNTGSQTNLKTYVNQLQASYDL